MTVEAMVKEITAEVITVMTVKAGMIMVAAYGVSNCYWSVDSEPAEASNFRRY